ncbi:MAG: 30S ribosomal protein S4 [Leptospiraceae bacterium]|nr:30S ribosomal protein S4 [Leptospiraceae bacterium]
MANYRGPRLKKVRRFGIPLSGLTRKSAQKRPYPPGQGAQNRRTKFSEFKKKLYEKQKLRYNYGVSEKQLRHLMVEAKKSHEPTGNVLLRLLEQRLDNVVFRLGLAPTIPAARQLVAHGHIQVNGERVDIASFRVKPGDVVAIREKSRGMDAVKGSVESPALRLADYLSLDVTNLAGKMEALPGREDISLEVDEQLVVEYYAQRM